MADDAADLHEYLSQPETVAFEPYEVMTFKQTELELAKRIANPGFLAVVLKSENKVIGNLYCEELPFGTWEVGYVFNAKYTGQGLATEAVSAFIADIFTNKQAHRIIAGCDPENTKSWKLLERLNFRREGLHLADHWFRRKPNGEPDWRNGFEYALLASEWQALQTPTSQRSTSHDQTSQISATQAPTLPDKSANWPSSKWQEDASQ
jgi:RimJ/RimL family protein N-acetyltransferase